MAAQVLSFLDRSPRAPRDWSQQELAEFYRVESALLQAGVDLETERGLSDEGDPWFVFCRTDNGDVFMHFSRVDGLYVADAAGFQAPVRGRDFQALVRDLLTRYPLAESRMRGGAGSNVFMHPAALLIALVGAAFFHSNSVKAGELNEAPAKPETRRASLILIQASGPVAAGAFAAEDANGVQAAAVILSAILSLHDDVWRLAPMAGETAAVAAEIDFQTRIVAAIGDLRVNPAAALQAAAEPTGIVLDIAATRQALVTNAEAEAALLAVVGQGPSVQAAPANLTPAAPVDWAVAAAPEGQPAAPTADRPVYFARYFAAAVLDANTSEAVAVARIAVAEASGGQFDAVVRQVAFVDRLPTNLLTLITRGEHVSGEVPIAPAPAGPPPAAGVLDGAPIDPVATSAPATDVTVLRPSHDAMVDAAIAAFVARVKHLDVIMNDRTLILMDHDALSGLHNDVNLTSVTYTFEDGSSVSLVGTALELFGAGWASGAA